MTIDKIKDKIGDSLEEIKEREVAYTAIGLSFYSIYDHIQFDEWFDKFLLRDLNSSSSSPISFVFLLIFLNKNNKIILMKIIIKY